MKHFYKRILLSFIFLATTFSVTDLLAEGSKDFYPTGGTPATARRAVLVSAPEGGAYPGTFITADNYPYLTQAAHFAYLKQGEYITAGSSAQNVGSGRIKFTAPDGTTYTTTNNNTGKIADRTEEVNGSRASGGFTPFERLVAAGQEGVWKIEFIAPSFTGTSPPDIAADGAWTQANNSCIYAWDVSVFAAATGSTPITGRVYANVLNLIMPQNWVANNGFYGKHYVYTKDGYSYLVSENGANGAAYTFFVNSKGFTTGVNGAGNKTYGSVNNSHAYNATTEPTGFKTKTPLTADDANVVTHKIFYNKPFFGQTGIPATANIAPGTGSTTTWVKAATIITPTVSSVTFEGVENSGSNVSNKGANIKFTSNVDGTYKIVIPGNGSFIDRVLTGPSVNGANTVFWDGKAGTSVADPITPGTKVPPGTTVNTVKIQLYGAEIHFPFFDVEINPTGMKIEQLTTDGNYNLANSDAGYDVVYWDDTNITSSTNVPKPKKAILGLKTIHSATANPGETTTTANGHIWGANTSTVATGAADYGNLVALDTYTFVPGPEVSQSLSVTIDAADLEVTSAAPSVTTTTAGNEVTYTVVIKNLFTAGVSVSDVTGAKFGFEHPAGFTVTSAVLTVNTGTIVETSPTNGATVWNSTLSMTNGSQATYVIKGTVGAALKNTTLTTRATILRPADIADPDATDESTASFSGSADTECNGNPSGAGCNNIKSPTGVTITNNPPVGVPNVSSTNMNTTLTVADGATGTGGDLLVNDTDADGDVLTITKYTISGVDYTQGTSRLIPGQGTITINANGSYTFVPVTNFSGAVTTITYTLSDGTATATTTLNITVNASNTAPTPVANTKTVLEDSGTTNVAAATAGVAGGLLANDTDPESDALTITKFTVNGVVGDQAVGGAGYVIASVGTIVINADGSYSFTPVANYNGSVPQITYTVSDGSLTATSTLDITVTPVNDVPSFVKGADRSHNASATNSAQTVAAWASSISKGPTDENGQTVNFIVSNDKNALFSTQPAIDASGQLTYTLAANAAGKATVIVAIKDNGGTLNGGVDQSADQTFLITIKPVGTTDSYNVAKNVALTSTVTANDGPSANGTGITGQTVVAGSTAPAHGAIVVNGDGTITYTPTTGYTGTDTYTYILRTADGVDSDPITVNLTIANTAPVPVANTNSMLEDGTAISVTAAASGTTGGLLTNDADANGDVLTITKFTVNGVVGDKAVGGAGYLIASVGTIVINANGSYTFTPVANYNGSVPQITYTVSDGTTTATSTLDITVTPVNDVPAFTKGADQVATLSATPSVQTVNAWATGLSKGPADESGQVLNFIVSNDKNSLFSVQPAISATGVLTYTAAANTYGKATVTVAIHDDGGTTNGGVDTSPTQTFVISIKPVGTTDNYNTPKNVAITSTVTSNDGPSGVGTTVVAGSTAPAHGAIVVNGDGTITYTPTNNYTGTDSYTYILRTPDGVDSDPITVNITIANSTPVLVANTNTVLEDSGTTTVAAATAGVTGGLLANDTDADGDALTITKFTVNGVVGDQAVGGAGYVIASVGTIVINANGSYNFTPVANYNGSVPQITYTATDGNTTATSTLDITVTPVNDVPSFVKGTDRSHNASASNSAQTVAAWASSVSKGPANESGQTVSFQVSNDNNALFSTQPAIDASGQLTYTLAANAAGKTTVTVAIKDNGGTTNGGVDQSADQTFLITIKPVGGTDSYSTPKGVAITSTVTANDGPSSNGTGITGQTVVAGSTAPAHGAIVVNGDGTITYTPTVGYTGADSYTYILRTADGVDSDPITVNITITNTTPVLTANTKTVLEDSGATTVAAATAGVTGGLLANDTDADGDVLSITKFTVNGVVGDQAVGGAGYVIASVGTIVINSNGSYTFTPVTNYNGSVPQITYTATDGTTTATSTLDITVTPVNDVPSFVKGADRSHNASASNSAQTVAAWASSISKGPANESGQTVSFQVSNDNNALFSTQPAIDASGQLTYTLAANAAGKTTVTVSIKDNGGTLNGGVDQSADQTFLITVKPVGGTDSYSTPKGVAITSTVTANDGPSSNGTGITGQTVVAGSTAPAHGAIVVNGDGTIKYTPTAGYIGTDSYTYILRTADGVDSDPITVNITITNTIPVLAANTKTVLEDSGATTVAAADAGVTGGLLVNDADADGDALTITKFTVNGVVGDKAVGGAGYAIASVGTIVINANGSYTFTPVANYNGSVPQITYTVSDGTTTASSTLDITVTPVNDVPAFTKGADQVATLSATPSVQTVNAWATGLSKGPADENGQVLNFIVSNDKNSLFSVQPAISATGVLTYTAAANTYGKATVTVAIHDDGGTANGGVDTSPTQTFVISIKPVGTTDTYTTPKNVAITSTVTTNDGPSGVGTTVVAGSTAPAHGAIVVNGDGTITYTPTANYTGTDSYTYILRTPDGVDSDPITVNITIANSIPVLAANTKTVLEDSGTTTVAAASAGVTGGLLTNDTDENGDALTVTKFTVNGVVGDQAVGGAGYAINNVGTIVINANGSYSFTPVANYNGTVPQITYTVSDGTTTASSTLDITVTPVNDVPAFTKGADQVATLSATPSVQTVNAWATGLSKGPADENGQALNFIVSNDKNSLFSVQPAISATGVLTYTAAANTYGKATVTVAIHDDGGTANGGVDTSPTQTFVISIKPVGTTDTYTTPKNVAITSTVTTNDGPSGVGTTVVAGGTAPAHGAIVVNGDGTITYTPTTGYIGTDSYTYILRTPDGVDSDPITVNVTITNTPPVLTANTNTTLEDVTLTVTAASAGVTGGLLTNDTDADGDPLSVTSYTIAGIVGTQTIGTPVLIPSVGTITILATGGYTFVPVANYNGTVPTITYTATDGTASATSTLTISITPVNDPPTPTADVNTTLEDTPLIVTAAAGILSNDTDIDGDSPLAVSKYTIAGIIGDQIVGNDVVIPGVGTINISANGGYKFTPALDFNGAVPVITYTVDDLQSPSGSATSTLTLNVTPVNDIPSFAKGADQTTTIGAGAQTVTSWATAISKGPANESAQNVNFVATNDNNTLFTTQPAINPAGELTYTPAPGKYGKATVTVYIHDDGGTANGGVDQSATQTFVINIKPVGTIDSDITPINTPTTTVVTANDGVSGVGTTVVAGSTAPAHGSITINTDGSITYTPANNYVGSDTYTYVLRTPDGVDSDPITVNITVYNPKIALAKEGTYFDFNANGKVDVGDRINYTFVVTNTGTVPVTNITVTDPNATITGGPIPSLAVGGVNNSTFTGYHTLTQAEIDNGGVFNLATANGKDPKNNTITTTSNDPTPLLPTDPSYPVTPPTPACPTCTVTPIVQTGALSLAKDGTYFDFNANGKVDVGDRINYTFVVTNTGNVTLTNITVTDPGATITGGPIASLAVAGVNNSTFTGYHTLTQAEIDNGGVFNLATANGKDPKNNTITTTSNDPTPLLPTDPSYPVTPPTPACPTCTVTPIVQTGALSLAKDGTYFDFNANGKVDVGDRINYTFVVTNTGNVTLTNVTITDPQAVITGGPIASLAVGGVNNSTFTGYHVLTQADLDNSGVYNLATANGKDPKNNTITTTSNDPTPLAPGDPNYPVTPPTPACPTCTITPIVQAPAMTLKKDGTYFDFNANGKVDVGDRINYTFVVTNTGNVTLTNVTVTDPGATITGGPIASLAVAGVDNSTFTGYHTLTQAEIDNGGVFNLATANGKDPKNNTITTTSNDPTPLLPTDPSYPVTPPTPACPTCTVTPIVQTGALSLAKDGTYFDFNANGKVDVGDRINYTFVVTNTGNVTLTNITVTDPNATITGGPIASLAVAGVDNSTFTGYHTLTQAEIDNGGVFNLATANGKDPKNNTITTTSNDPTPLLPTDPGYPVTPPTPACPTCTVTPIVQSGSLSLLKDGTYLDFNANGKVDVGDRINYTFVVTNTGNVTLTNITVTDPGATITGGPIPSLAVGGVNNSTFTGYHTLTQAEIDNGGVFNLATANGKDPKNNTITTTSNDPTPLLPTDPSYPVTPPTPACPTCTVTPIVQTGALSLAKDGTYFDFNANGKVDVGDRINYTFVVTNTGNVTLTNVTITDAQAVITGGPIASLAPGAVNNATFTGYHVLTQADIDNSGVYNLATANGKDPKNNTITTTSNDPTPLAPGDPNYPVTPPTPACPTCTITPIVQAPAMTLKKDGTYNDFNADGKVNVGDRINYVFTLTNTGNVTITNVMISDANAVITGGPIASFAPGAVNSSTFTGYHVLTAADLDNGGVFNVATATGKDPKGNDVPPVKSDDPTPLLPTDPSYPVTPPTPACPTCTVTPIVQVGSLTLAKEGVYFDQNADGKVNAGDRINYTFKVTNTGNVTLTNITVTDPNAVIAGGPLATLAAGASDATTFTGYHVLTAADLNNAGVFNVATVKGTDPRGNEVTKPSDDPTPLLPTDPSYPITPPVTPCPTCTVTPLPQNPSMRIVKDGTYSDTNGDGKVNPGDRINYTFNVINTGNVTITNIMITDNNATVVGGPITSLAAGASNNTTFTAYHVLTQAEIDNGGVFNVATATGKDPRGNDVPPTKSDDPTPIPPGDPSYPVTPPVTPCPTCTITPIVQAPSMRLVKDGTYFDFNANGKVDVGDRINYTFTVINTGNVTLTNINVTDPNAVVSGGPLASLAPGASNATMFTAYHVLTQAEIDNGGVFNVATATGTDPKGGTVTTPSNDPTPILPTDPSYPVTPPVTPCPTCTITPIVQAPSMRLVKDGTYNDTNGDGKVNPGDRINYTFIVTNTGNVTLTNIKVTDPNAIVSGGPLASLAPGASNATMFTAYHVLTQAEIDNGGVFNVATATGTDPKGGTVTTPSNDPTPILPTDPSYPVTPPVTPCPTCTITPIVMAPSLSLLKDGSYNDTNGDGKVNIGDRINYTFVVTNTGNVTLTNVTVTDPNAVVSGGPLASLAPGASNSTTFTAYHVLTQADIDNKGVFNSATASGKDPKGGNVITLSTDPTPLLPSSPLYPINPPVPACATCTVTPITQSGSIALVKLVTNTGTGVAGAFVLGNPIQYTFTITNTGNVTLSNIVLTDAKLGIGTVNVSGTLAPGASTTVVRTYTITAADIAAGNVTNTATINATTPAGVAVTDISGSTTTNNTPTVTGLGIPPVAANDAASTRQNDPVKISVETNDVAGSTPIVVNSIVITVAPLHGTVVANADGTVTYTPNPGYVGTDVFTYTVKDTNGQTSNPATVNVTVIASAPKAVNDVAKTSINKQVIIPVLDNDVKDGANFNLSSIEIMTQPAHGRLVTNSDGTITYIPNTDYAGLDSFTYRVKDAYGNYTNIATVNITVEGFFAGNVITPDGDGKNDVWVIVGTVNYDRIEVEFYNRWGNQVYVNKNYKNDWNGEGLNEGTYYYTVRLIKGGVTTTAKGWVLVKR